VEFGFDESTLYIRVDGTVGVRGMLAGGFSLAIRFLKPAGLTISLRERAGSIEPTTWRNSNGPGPTPFREMGLRAAAGDVAEFAIPFTALEASAGERVALFVTLSREDAEVDRQPRHQAIEIELPSERFAMRTWTA
jgi:hypothetical protein